MFSILIDWASTIKCPVRGNHHVPAIAIDACVPFARVRPNKSLMTGAGCVGGQMKEWMGCFLDDLPQRIRHQRRPMDDCSPGRGGIAQNGGAFHGEMDRFRESRCWSTACSIIVCPNVTGRTKERVSQSKRARAGSLALVD